MAVIQISLNGETREVPEGVHLDRLLELFSFPTKRIAIELNGDVVRKADWPGLIVRDDDRLEVVHFVGGG